MVLHVNHHLLLHGELGCLPHCREDDHADRERGRSRGTNADFLWNFRGWKYDDVLQSKYQRLSNCLKGNLNTKSIDAGSCE